MTPFGEKDYDFKIATNLQTKESVLSVNVYPTDKAERFKFVEHMHTRLSTQQYGFIYLENSWNGRHELLDTKYQKSKIGRSGIAKQKFVMCVQPSMQSYLEKLSKEISFDGGILFYSMWRGYKGKEDIAAFLQFMQDKGVKIIALHTSGHADAETIQSFINDVNPTYIIPVHTENAE